MMETNADDTTIDQLEDDIKRYRGALRDIVKRIRLSEDRPEVLAEIAEDALKQ